MANIQQRLDELKKKAEDKSIMSVLERKHSLTGEQFVRMCNLLIPSNSLNGHAINLAEGRVRLS